MSEGRASLKSPGSQVTQGDLIFLVSFAPSTVDLSTRPEHPCLERSKENILGLSQVGVLGQLAMIRRGEETLVRVESNSDVTRLGWYLFSDPDK